MSLADTWNALDILPFTVAKWLLTSHSRSFELLRLEEVYGAIAYYLANQARIDAYLIRQNEKWAEGRHNAEPLPADLRERLLRARDELHTARLS